MTVFALVHGACHGAWCWERVAPELEARGHRVVAVELPCDDVAATSESYADVVESALDTAWTDDVVVVGHSLAGLMLPVIADRRPLRRLIYLCALVPMPGYSFVEQLGLEPDTLLPEYRAVRPEPDDDGLARWVDERVVRSFFYADCTAADARAAFERLRPQALTPYSVPCRLTEFPSVPVTYVVCSEDRVVNPEAGRRVAHERLDAELAELPGSHSPFISRPHELAELLDQRAD